MGDLCPLCCLASDFLLLLNTSQRAVSKPFSHRQHLPGKGMCYVDTDRNSHSTALCRLLTRLM